MREADNIKSSAKHRFSWRLLGENFVFKQGEHYYKMPSFLARNIMYRKTDSYEKVVDSMRIIQQYFGALTKIPETKVLKDKQKNYLIKQKNISGEKLTKHHLTDNPKLLSKFRRLIIANEIMWKNEGVFLDLLGSDIVAHPNTIHNLLTDGKDIYVFDFGLLERTSKNIFFKYFSRFAAWFQLQFIKFFF